MILPKYPLQIVTYFNLLFNCEYFILASSKRMMQHSALARTVLRVYSSRTKTCPPSLQAPVLAIISQWHSAVHQSTDSICEEFGNLRPQLTQDPACDKLDRKIAQGIPICRGMFLCISATDSYVNGLEKCGAMICSLVLIQYTCRFSRFF